jgi:hypothetical protein
MPRKSTKYEIDKKKKKKAKDKLKLKKEKSKKRKKERLRKEKSKKREKEKSQKIPTTLREAQKCCKKNRTKVTALENEVALAKRELDTATAKIKELSTSKIVDNIKGAAMTVLTNVKIKFGTRHINQVEMQTEEPDYAWWQYMTTQWANAGIKSQKAKMKTLEKVFKTTWRNNGNSLYLTLDHVFETTRTEPTDQDRETDMIIHLAGLITKDNVQELLFLQHSGDIDTTNKYDPLKIWSKSGTITLDVMAKEVQKAFIKRQVPGHISAIQFLVRYSPIFTGLGVIVLDPRKRGCNIAKVVQKQHASRLSGWITQTTYFESSKKYLILWVDTKTNQWYRVAARNSKKTPIYYSPVIQESANAIFEIFQKMGCTAQEVKVFDDKRSVNQVVKEMPKDVLKQTPKKKKTGKRRRAR